ncbi:MAG: hypothetical protein L3J46_06025, partial [Kangiellaceae bacterium]|nr:hypothetical protein [Kangiellaceae bacterium]
QFVQNIMKKKIVATAKGPNKEQRAKLPTYVWGEVSNTKGEIIAATMETCNGYELTCLGAIEIALYLLENDQTGGAFTPSKLIDNQLVSRLTGTKEVQFSS